MPMAFRFWHLRGKWCRRSNCRIQTPRNLGLQPCGFRTQRGTFRPFHAFTLYRLRGSGFTRCTSTSEKSQRP